jgi:nicotianamine synthase
MTTPAALVSRIGDIADQLHDSPDLTPRPELNALFSELVGLSLGLRGRAASDVLDGLGPKVHQVRRLCSAGESALEQYWADRVATASDPWAELERFPYVDNYRDLTRLEVSALAAVGAVPREVAMVGSGPLPLSGLFLAEEHGADVLLVDRDEECLELGDQLVVALDRGSRFRSLRADATTDRVDLTRYDTVLLAALVGTDDDEKRDCLRRTAAAMRPGAHLVVRSAAGLRELLYPPVDLVGVDQLRPLLEVHPHHDVVNSVVIAEVTSEVTPEVTVT